MEESKPEDDTMGESTMEELMDVKDSQEKTQSGTSSVKSDGFNWDKYLEETGSVGAPCDYFRQAKTPPTNDFKVGMKLEACDPRSVNSVCIASVIAITGARLCLRLDGDESKSEFWRLVDSSDIQPVGTCENKGKLLQPPVGYQMSISSWPLYLVGTLSESELAPAEFFKEEPPKPPKNNFKVGMKIEAVDLKNPFMIAPATIRAINGDHIHVTFDGWGRAFDYWCKYDSRSIFPVGWCGLTGDVLQPPGNAAEKKPRSGGVTLSLKTKEPAPDSGPSTAKKKGKTWSSNSKGTQSSRPPPLSVVLPRPKEDKKSGRTTPKSKTSETEEKCIPVVPSTSSASVHSLRRKSGAAASGSSQIVMSTLSMYVNKRGDCGPFLDPKKVKKLPDRFGPGPVNVMLQRIVQACVDCAIQAKTVFQMIKPDNRGGEVITASFDGKAQSVQLPPGNSASFALRFLENFCRSLQCDKFLSNQPFSPSEAIAPTDPERNEPEEEEVIEKKRVRRCPPQPIPFVPVSPKVPKKTARVSEVSKSVSEITPSTSSTALVVKKSSTLKEKKKKKGTKLGLKKKNEGN